MARGTLFLVVGPSGAGKDTLIAGARAALEPGGAHVFPRRAITRPAEAGGEDHEAVSPEEFAAREADGGFFAAWRAHGLAYGLPAYISAALESGRHVVANVSRTVLADVAERNLAAVIVEVSAPAELLAERLAARGREDRADAARRLAREAAPCPDGVPVRRVVNDGTPAAGIARMVAALSDA
ncbi:MAG: phosphonate metabolism protein/1,5-bisphosphokinase (PRPP-forming) PhnN [Defluviicoccus sp.]|nr:phosphonate metabolism protein/1,5-bisphosphokinase (PRPP-forming) PhnN [Defluviicoccus sp.]MDE0383979.1 phosphonate metabolism protein/1,5-bisphosphokinase (PRPP-forming) PhnN [Defluviicoccus sp.]